MKRISRAVMNHMSSHFQWIIFVLIWRGMKYENPQSGTTVLSRPLCRQNISWNSKLRGVHVAFTIFRDSAKVQHYILFAYSARHEANMSKYAFHMLAKCQSLSFDFFFKTFISARRNPKSRGNKTRGSSIAHFPDTWEFMSFAEAFNYDGEVCFYLWNTSFLVVVKRQKTSK